MASVRRHSLRLAAWVCSIAALSGPHPEARQPADLSAVAALDQSIARAEESLRIGEREIAESHYRDALLRGWMILGALHSGAGELEDARRAFERASASAVDNNDALQSLAIVTLQLGEAAEAAEILTRMTTASPGNIQLRLTLAQALVAMGKSGEAAQELDVAQGIAPQDPEVLFALAAGYLRVKKVETAERLFARVAAAHPQPETYVLIGRTYRDYLYYDRARTALQRALKMNPRVPRAHYYLGTSALLEEGVVLVDEAIAEFRQELEITPGDPLATLRLGVVLVEARRYDEAMPLLEKAIRVPAPPYDAWMYLGRGQLAKGRPADAVVSLRKALETAEKTGQQVRRRSIHYQLAMALRDSGAAAEAEREFAEAQRLSVEQAENEREQLTRFLADAPDAAGSHVRALPFAISGFENLTPDKRGELRSRVSVALARTCLNLGILHAQAGRFPRAAELFEASASIDPAFPQVQYSLGVAYFNAELYEKAVPALVKAVAQQPQNAEASRMLALASLNAGDYARAADLLRKDPKLPSDPSLQYAFGLALVRSDRADEAEKIFSRVLTQHPDVPELNVVLGQIHAAQGDFDQAIVSLRRALELEPGVAEANSTLGDIYMRQGQFGPAAEALRTELAAHPRNVVARNTLATVLELDGKSDDALKELRAIVAVKPNYADARYLFGKILLARGSAEEALMHLEVAVKLAPGDANIYYQLGQAYQRLGRTELASRAFETFQRLKDKARGGKS
jgi:tetratricopeptide (TPR) repeat protein